MLFVWFLKEKGLLAPLLKDYDRKSGDSSYRAALPNLFFATLNPEVHKRGFAPKKNMTCYRYPNEMAAPPPS